MILNVVKRGWEKRLMLRFVMVKLNRRVLDGVWMVWYFFKFSRMSKFLMEVVNDKKVLIIERVMMNESGLFLISNFLVCVLYIFLYRVIV